MSGLDISSSQNESPYEMYWENPAYNPHQLSSGTILQYFCDLSNPFYDRECNNEIIRMQGLSQDRLTSLSGLEFYLYHAQVGCSIFTIEPSKVDVHDAYVFLYATPLGAYPLRHSKTGTHFTNRSCAVGLLLYNQRHRTAGP